MESDKEEEEGYRKAGLLEWEKERKREEISGVDRCSLSGRRRTKRKREGEKQLLRFEVSACVVAVVAALLSKTQHQLVFVVAVGSQIQMLSEEWRWTCVQCQSQHCEAQKQEELGNGT